ncbi:MAG: pyruvate kinase [Alphaproteobacteria bacterium]|nr:pyruvate kinase [Alphaproteobacteria bacterium]
MHALTRIVATIGPATATADAVRRLVASGMNVARLNGSHNTLAWHAATIRTIRQAAPQVPILLDVPGKKIRTAMLDHEPQFDAGDTIVLTTDATYQGSDKVVVKHPTLHDLVAPGQRLFADDGTLEFEVTAVQGQDIFCRAGNAGTLRSRKGINLPGLDFGAVSLTADDHTMMAFARDQGVDFVGISFVESARHVAMIREAAGPKGPRIVAKIESARGIENLEDVVAACDAVMIDRGDLAVETDLATVTLQQKRILEAAIRAAKPVIVATEMLHSMIENPYPTKAEVADITNAILDGCAAMMLSGETAVGKFPDKAVGLMRRVAAEVEPVLVPARMPQPQGDSTFSVGEAINLLCRTMPITKIVAVTRTGHAARVISAYYPCQPILAVSDDPGAARRIALYRGVEGLTLPFRFTRQSADHIADAIEYLWQTDRVNDADLILAAAVSYPRQGNRLNSIQIHKIADLVEVLGWVRWSDTSAPKGILSAIARPQSAETAHA